MGGLQVMNRDGNWVDGTPIRRAFVINIGDQIQKLTNDIYLANMHRVIRPVRDARHDFFMVHALPEYDFGGDLTRPPEQNAVLTVEA